MDRLTATIEAPPAATWQLIIDNAEPGELFTIGFQAWVTYKLQNVAELGWRRAGDTGHIDAMTYLAFMLEGRGDLDEAETWYRRAADTGNPTPMCNLGGWLRGRGNLDEGETWYRRAAEAGDTRAMSNLGVLLQKRGDINEAETWHRRAAEADDTAP